MCLIFYNALPPGVAVVTRAIFLSCHLNISFPIFFVLPDIQFVCSVISNDLPFSFACIHGKYTLFYFIKYLLIVLYALLSVPI